MSVSSIRVPTYVKLILIQYFIIPGIINTNYFIWENNDLKKTHLRNISLNIIDFLAFLDVA